MSASFEARMRGYVASIHSIKRLIVVNAPPALQTDSEHASDTEVASIESRSTSPVPDRNLSTTLKLDETASDAQAREHEERHEETEALVKQCSILRAKNELLTRNEVTTSTELRDAKVTIERQQATIDMLDRVNEQLRNERDEQMATASVLEARVDHPRKPMCDLRHALRAMTSDELDEASIILTHVLHISRANAAIGGSLLGDQNEDADGRRDMSSASSPETAPGNVRSGGNIAGVVSPVGHGIPPLLQRIILTLPSRRLAESRKILLAR